jgi:hypothetical protein
MDSTGFYPVLVVVVVMVAYNTMYLYPKAGSVTNRDRITEEFLTTWDIKKVH